MPSPTDDMITGRELAEATGEAYTTIDYWSKMGLLDYERRGSRRLYPRSGASRRCVMIRDYQNSGLNLAAIKLEIQRTDRP